MHIVRRAIFIGCVIFAGALIGDGLQWLVPQAYLSDAKAAVGMVQGLVTLLLALVLGLLVWTSYGVYAQQHSEAQTLGSQILQLDLALDRLGPAAAKGRELLRRELAETRKRFWDSPGGAGAALSYAQSRAELKQLDCFFASLRPEDDDQRAAIASARSHSQSILETHYLMARQLKNPLPNALVNSVVLWAVLVFFCVGLASTFNALALVMPSIARCVGRVRLSLIASHMR